MRSLYTNEQIKGFISQPLFDQAILLNRDKSYSKISIVIPSYNQGQFLERTILSILNQNYPNSELIIIDGGSQDESLKIIKKYEKHLSYWVSEKDKGEADALNKGFSVTEGEIVCLQNADDIFLPDTFNKIAQLFKENPKVDVIYGNRIDVNENDEIIGESRFTRFSPIVYRYDGMPLGNQSAFWRKNLFLKIGMFDINLCFAMDYEFFMRAALQGAKFKYVPHYFGTMRRHSASKTEKFLGKPPHQKECDKIDKKYGRKRWLNFPFKMYSLLYRTINYFLQGDGDYVFKGVGRRFKNKSILSGR